MRKLQATTQCNWNWFWLSAGRRVSNREWWRATTPPTTTTTINKQCGTLGKFSKNLRDPFSVEYSTRVQRPFRQRATVLCGSFKCFEQTTPKTMGLIFFFFWTILSLSVSNLMCVCVFFFHNNKCNCFLVVCYVWKGMGWGEGEETLSMMSLTGLFVCGASWNWNGNQSWEGGNA